MASFPTAIVAFAPNSDNSTTIDEDYMDARDGEIEAIEKSFGVGLVSSTALTDPDERLSGYMTTSNEGYLSLGYKNGKNVRIGDGNMAYTPQVPLEIVSTNPRIRLHDTAGANMQIRSRNDQFEIHRMQHDGTGGRRLFSINEGAPTDSVLVDSAGRLGLGMTGIASVTAPLDVNGDTVRLRDANAPADASEGQVGDIRWDSGAIYVKTSDDPTHVWKMAALATVTF